MVGMHSGTPHSPGNPTAIPLSRDERGGPRPAGDWRWRRVVVVSVVLATAAAVVTLTAVNTGKILRGDRLYATTAGVIAPGTAGLSPARAALSATCVAWPSVKRSMDAAASTLPAGWYWHPSQGKADIVVFAAAVSRDLDLFGAQIAGTDPVEVSLVAHSFISTKRLELSALIARTFNDTVASAVTSARTDLNLACAIPNKGIATA